MSEDRSVYWDPQKFLLSVQELTVEEIGVYVMLSHASHNMVLKDDPRFIKDLLRINSNRWSRIRASLVKRGKILILDCGRIEVDRTIEVRIRQPVSLALRLLVLDRDNHECVYCGSMDTLEYDHVIPVVQGGPTDLGNLVAACRPCNGSKGGRTPAEWRGSN